MPPSTASGPSIAATRPRPSDRLERTVAQVTQDRDAESSLTQRTEPQAGSPLAWSRRRWTAFFNEQALPDPYRRVETVKRIRREYWPAKEWRIVYALHVSDETLPPLLATVTLSGHADASARPGPPRLIEFFPADEELPSLAAASDAEQATAALDRLAAERGRVQRHEVIDVQVMRYRPHRQCVLRYTVASPAEDPDVLIGKLYLG